MIILLQLDSFGAINAKWLFLNTSESCVGLPDRLIYFGKSRKYSCKYNIYFLKTDINHLTMALL